MKIEKDGQFWWVGLTFTCRACNCRFTLEKKDANVSEFIMQCPTCKHRLNIKKKSKSIFDEIFGDDGIFGNIFGTK